jgi:F420 biosynthesis protein FbiB-like protein
MPVAPAAADLACLIEARRSIRRYTPQPVPAALVERLLEAAAWAPSAHNRQPWRFAVLASAPARAALARAMGEQLARDRAADGDDPAIIAADVARSAERITTAPVAILACFTAAEMDAYPDSRRGQAERHMAAQSLALAVQNLLLLAAAEGLGACWLCAPLFCPGPVRQALNLPADWEPQALVTLGFPAEAGRVRPRKPLSEITLWR